MALDNDRSRVAHLLRRAGFGATPAELASYTALGYAGALDRLLNYSQVDNSALTAQIAPLQLDPSDPNARKQIEPAKYLWLNRMLYTQRPLEEKMTLFWHNHFATANSKVANALLMQQQIQLFRDTAMGNFETLLQNVTRDPAMLIWLDNAQNRKNAPNENYAREVMELFTVGIGNYTDDDVKQGARAFTGYTLDKNRQFVFNPATHDAGPKTFLGQTSNFDANDILGVLVRHPATARRLTTQLFEYFAYPNPDSGTIDRLASTYTSSGFNIGAVVRDIFTGPEFLSAPNFHGQVKQPADYVVGALKELNVQNVGPDITQHLRRMGQDILNPPDVSGWKGGADWINSSTLFERFNFAEQLSAGRTQGKPYFVDIPGQISAQNVAAPAALTDYYVGSLVDGDVTPEGRQALLDYLNQGTAYGPTTAAIDLKGRGLVHLVMSLPTYQLA